MAFQPAEDVAHLPGGQRLDLPALDITQQLDARPCLSSARHPTK
jgi:hypothetical protein